MILRLGRAIYYACLAFIVIGLLFGSGYVLAALFVNNPLFYVSAIFLAAVCVFYKHFP